MQLTPLPLLVSRCEAVLERLQRLQQKNPARSLPQPLFAIDGLTSDLQRVYAVERILMHLEAATPVVQAEVADAITDLLETINVCYAARFKACLTC